MFVALDKTRILLGVLAGSVALSTLLMPVTPVRANELGTRFAETLAVIGQPPPTEPVVETTQQRFSVFLPMLGSGIVNRPIGPIDAPPPGGGTNNPPPGDGGIVAPATGSYFLHKNQMIPAWGSSAALDPRGGAHIAYAKLGNGEPNTPGYYAYCPPTSSCASPADWTTLVIQDRVQSAQLKLTRDGRPRLLLETNLHDGGYNSVTVVYAACDQNCTSLTNWRTAVVAQYESRTFTYTKARRWFALDQLDRPRAILSTPKSGNYYLWCDENCLAPENWQNGQMGVTETDSNGFVSYEQLDAVVLRFTPDGHAHLVAQSLFRNGFQVIYATCATACGLEASWQRIVLSESNDGTQPSNGLVMLMPQHFDLEIAQSGTMVVGIVGTEPGGALQNTPRLYLMWCHNNCLSSAGWQNTSVVSVADGLDVALDGQDRPRLVGGGLDNQTMKVRIVYRWCEADCYSANSRWKSQIVDSAETMAEHIPPVPPLRPLSCIPSTTNWEGPQVATMLIDAQGNPRFLTENVLFGACPEYQQSPFHPDWKELKGDGTRTLAWMMRWIQLPQPN